MYITVKEFELRLFYDFDKLMFEFSLIFSLFKLISNYTTEIILRKFILSVKIKKMEEVSD